MSVYVEFYLSPVENRDESIKQGHYVAEDKEYIKIMPPGGSLVVEKEVTPEIIQKYEAQYKAWKRNEELPEDGHPLKLWPPISPAQLSNCLAINVRTVENLAAANEQVLKRLGMGGRALKDKAAAWLQSAGGDGKLSEEMAALKVENESLKAMVEDLTKSVETLKAAKPRRGKSAN